MTPRVVLDASAALGAVLQRADAQAVLGVLGEASVVVAPGLFVSEVANGLRGYVAAGHLDRPTAIDRYEEALDLVDDIVPDREFGVEALSEAARLGHPAYDLIYAVLARRTGSALLTRDRRLAALLPKLGVHLALEV